MATELIYGLECTIPDQPPITKIDGNKLPVKKQKFRRVDWESMFEDEELDTDDNPLYTAEQDKFIERELERCDNGFWFMNKGVPTYLTGKAYYYYNYWTLENDIPPQFRESDRLFFIFFDACLKHPKIKGLIRIKNRRLGATSIGACIETYIATFNANRKCGNVSKTDTDAKKLFQDMIVFSFYKMPIFLRPRVDTSSTSKSELHFIKPAKKGKAAKNRKIEGLNSKIDFQPTSLGSYDSTRLSFGIVDEGGKWEKVDVNAYFNDVIKECVSEGAVKKGFLYLPSTVNPPNKGGANFQKLWDGSDHIGMGIGNTETDLVRFFMPSYMCLAGFFDEYGHSVVEPPDAETIAFMVKSQGNEPEEERVDVEDLAKGAKKYLEDALDKLTDEERKDGFRRKYPITESDSFSFGSTSSPFNQTKIKAQIKNLQENRVPLRRGRLYVGFDKKVHFADDSNGPWLIYKPPSDPNCFSIDEQHDLAKPENFNKYRGGVDTYRFDKTQTLGSSGVIWIGSQFDSTDDESGELVALYVGRPSLTEFFWKECLMAGMWYGAKLNFEKDATQEYKKYFNNTMPNLLQMNCNGFLLRKPDAAIDINRKSADPNRYDYGVSSADPFTFAKEIELAQAYIEKYCDKIVYPDLLVEMTVFDVDNRTKYDKTIGFMVWLLGITGETKARKAPAKKPKLIQTYRVGY